MVAKIGLVFRNSGRRAILAAALGVLVSGSAALAQLSSHGRQTWVPGDCCVMPQETELFFGQALAVGDFDEDGYPDLAIGAPGATFIGGQHAGKVAILPGTAQGPSLVGQLALTEEDFGGTVEPSDHFGATLAVGDWNGDGADDLAIGVPDDNNAGGFSAGGVYVVYGRDAQGGGSGMFSDETEYWSYATVSLGGFAGPNEQFGASLVVGNFDGDAYADLAIGVAGDNVFAGFFKAGSVTILRGSALGLTPFHGITFHRDSPSVPGTVSDAERFGYALGAGDFDGDGRDELAIGAPGADIDGVFDVGEIVVLAFEDPGSGLEIVDSWTYSEGHGIPGAPEELDYYGRAFATGDFDADGVEDLAFGASYEGVGSNSAAGAFGLIEGNAGTGLDANASLWNQNDLPGQQARAFEFLSTAMASGDFDADGIADLVLGVPQEERWLLGSGGWQWVETGAIHVIPGAPGGLDLAATQTWVGTPAGISHGDGFGMSLAVGRLRGGSDSLAIGSPTWNTNGMWQVGRVSVLFSDHLFSDGFESGDTSEWSSTAP